MSRLAAIIVASAGLLALGACGVQVDPNRPEVPTAEPPALWSVATVDGAAASQQTSHICADASLRKGFVRALPTVAGQPCRIIGEPVEGPEMFAARCRVGEEPFTVNSMISGDRTRDFTIEAVINAVDRDARFEQTLHYRRLGACPAGWVVGDTAAAGDPQVVNTLSGATRALPSAFVPPAE